MPRTLLLILALVAAHTASGQDIARTTDVIYTKHDGVALTMDVFTPAKPNGAAIVKIVSGGWNSNHKGISDGGWTKYGYTTFVVVHGTQPRFHIDEIVGDLQRSVRFIRANAQKFGIDPNKIGVTGGSAGGHLSLMLATRVTPANAKAVDPVDRVSSEVNAVACYYPPVDFLNWAKDGDSKEGIGPLTTRAPAFGPIVDTAEGRDRAGHELSPFYWINSKQPPVYIVQGDADPLVPYSQALRFLAKATEVGAKAEVLIRMGGGHGGWVEMADDNVRMSEWFDLQLLGKQPAQPFNYASSKLPSTPTAKKAPAAKK
ncbi:MAG: alpha/beta hydrolase [Verrucomicrobiota bacterium]|jgi:acetyl esterase/lipase